MESKDDDTEATAAKGTEVEPSIPVSWHFYKKSLVKHAFMDLKFKKHHLMNDILATCEMPSKERK